MNLMFLTQHIHLMASSMVGHKIQPPPESTEDVFMGVDMAVIITT